MKLMSVPVIEVGEETDEMHLLTYRMKGMDTDLVKTRLFFQNMNP